MANAALQRSLTTLPVCRLFAIKCQLPLAYALVNIAFEIEQLADKLNCTTKFIGWIHIAGHLLVSRVSTQNKTTARMLVCCSQNADDNHFARTHTNTCHSFAIIHGRQKRFPNFSVSQFFNVRLVPWAGRKGESTAECRLCRKCIKRSAAHLSVEDDRSRTKWLCSWLIFYCKWLILQRTCCAPAPVALTRSVATLWLTDFRLYMSIY